MLKTVQTNTSSKKLRKFIAWSFNGYGLTFLSYYVLVWTGQLKLEYDYFISFASSVMIYGIGYLVFMRPEDLKDFSARKYAKSTLSSSACESILQDLKNHMLNNKPYLDSELKLTVLSDQLGYSTNHLSQVINEYEHKNFSDFINEYRIEEAKKIISTSSDKPRLIEVAIDSGFNNKVSFNNAFKRVTGCSPSEYYQSLFEKIIA